MSSRALSRYNAILDGEARARYLETKETMSSDHRTSLLDVKIELGRQMLHSCRLCERGCKADRANGDKGHCGVLEPLISSDFLHMGEEPELVPSYTVFFSGCTFNCVFCQNWDISTNPGSGARLTARELARKIEARGPSLSRNFTVARNVNWVGGEPTPNLPFMLEVLRECRANLPQVWNSNMYMSTDAMSLLNGVVDVYLSDFKYGNDGCAERLSNVPDYMRIITRNHRRAREHAEMIIRHLVLPGHVECCTRPALTWIAENLEDVKVNVMAQYRPEYRAREFPDVSKPLGMTDFRKAVGIAEDLGLDLCN